MAIPRVIHQIWLGPAPLPEEFAAYAAGWREQHPDWDYRLWTESDLPGDLRYPEIRDRLRVPAERSDILRLELLWRHGGVYLDTDFECRRPLDDVVANVDFVIAELRPGRTNNAFIATVPGHPIVGDALDELVPVGRHGLDKHASGPYMLDRVVQRHAEATILGPALFYPRTEEERAKAIAIHHVARSWKSNELFVVSLARLERRLRGRRKEREAAERLAARHERRNAQLARELERLEQGGRPRRTLVRAATAGLSTAGRLGARLRTSLSYRSRAQARRARRTTARVDDTARRVAVSVAARAAASRAPRSTIPRTLHRIWLDSETPPDHVVALGQEWARRHPHWRHRLWTEDDLPADLPPAALERLRNPRERTDIVRLGLLERLGGVVVDAGLDCRRRLDELLGDRALVVSRSTEGGVSSLLVGATPGHPVVRAALEAVNPSEWWFYDPAVAGDAFLTERLRDHPEALLPPDAITVVGAASSRTFAVLDRGDLDDPDLPARVKVLEADVQREEQAVADAEKRAAAAATRGTALEQALEDAHRARGGSGEAAQRTPQGAATALLRALGRDSRR